MDSKVENQYGLLMCEQHFSYPPPSTTVRIPGDRLYSDGDKQPDAGVSATGRYREMISWSPYSNHGNGLTTNLYSEQGHVKLSMQSDGNMVLCEFGLVFFQSLWQPLIFILRLSSLHLTIKPFFVQMAVAAMSPPLTLGSPCGHQGQRGIIT